MTRPLSSAVVAEPEATQFASGIDWAETILLLATVSVLLLAGGLALGYRFAETAARPTPMRPSEAGGTGATSPSDDSVGEQRAALIAGCLRLRGLLDDQVCIGVVEDTLAASGVEQFDPTGHRLDPSRHRIIATVAAPDAADDGVIARINAPGYVDAGRVLQPADVVVYKWSPS
ncbi:nucleotide exchange factor GrpE [Nocardia gipuzkoensis]|uniref:nucleotide exchange factor GrpE n=1 Tax=Nocardia gipuzkoensis TaxID=2749991 RepID=UPI003EDEB536